MVYIITYDLNKPGKDYSSLYKNIKEIGGWWHFLDSTWLVRTSLGANQIWNRLKPVVDDNDRVFVCKLSGDFSGWLPQNAWNWIGESNF